MEKYFLLASNLVPLAFLALFLTFTGFVLFSFILKTKNKLLALGSSMIIGPLGFLLILSLGSYLFKGQLAILVMFLGYLAITFLLFFKSTYFSFQQGVLGRKLSPVDIMVGILLVGYLGLIFLFAHRSFVGSDSDIFYAIATSFAKGNYPVVESWQPNFLTVYHQGTYLLEGAFWSLTGKDIELIHYFTSVYFIWAVFLFLTGLAREKVRSVFCLVPAVFGLILVGGPILLIKVSSVSGLLSSLNLQPGFASFQSSNGAGVTDLGALIYTNFYTFGLAVFLIFGLLFLDLWHRKFSLIRYVILLAVIVLGLSIDETFFPIEEVLFGGLVVWQLRTTPFLRKITNLGILSISFMVLFLLIQNPVRDSLFTPSPQESRFKILLENPIFGTLFYQPGEKTSWNGFSPGLTASEIVKSRKEYVSALWIGSWVRLDLRLILVFLFLGSLLAPSRWTFLLLGGSVLSYLLSLGVINTFWPPNALRISNQAFQLVFIALGFLIINLLAQKNILKRIVAISLILLLVPQIVVSHAKIFNQIPPEVEGRNNFTKQKKDMELEAITKYIPAGKVTIFLDRYPDIAPFSYLNYTALTKFGVFVPIAPPKVKILNPAPGIEWLDGVNSLSPDALRALNVEYVYIQYAAYSRLSKEKIAAIKNKIYFLEIRKFGDDGILYKVLPAFYSLSDEPNSLKQISLIIGSGKRVYLDRLKFSEVRKALILELAKKNTLLGAIPAHGGDFYMYIETLLPFEAETPEALKNLDYVITDKDKDPNNALPGRFDKFLFNNYISLWKTISLDKP